MRVSKSILINSLLLLSLEVAAQRIGFTIQIASTASSSEAQAIVAGLRAKGVAAYFVKAAVPKRGTRYRVRFGRFDTEVEAKAAGAAACQRGLITEFITAPYAAPAPADSPPAPLANEPESRPQPQAEKVLAAAPAANGGFDLALTNSNWRVARRGAAADKSLRAVYFVDSMTGWTAGDEGAVYRTTNGGRTWKPLLSESSVNLDYIYFADWSNGWMLGGTEDKAGESGRLLLMTKNGGRSWRQRPLPKVVSLHFIDPLTGWAVGNGTTLLRTSDGGEKWSTAPRTEEMSGNFRDVFFLDASHGWIVGNDQANGGAACLFATSDGGNSWRRVALNFPDSAGRPDPGELRSVRFTDLMTGTITGESRDGEARFFIALHTRDGGLTWEQFRIQSSAMRSAQFIDNAKGWSIASVPQQSSILRTDNGGKTWADDLTSHGGQIRNLFFLSPTKGWAVGDRGVILSYQETGNN